MGVTREAAAAGGHRLLMLAPNPEISGPVPGPIARLAYVLAGGLRSAGYVVDTELWGRHKKEEGWAEKILGRAGDIARIRRRIRSGAYDLVYVNTTHDWVALVRDLLLVLPAPKSVRWVFLVHGSRFRTGRRAFEAATGLLVRRASAVLLLSSEEISSWEALYPGGRFRLVANAFVPLAAGGGTSAKVGAPHPELLFAGRLIAEKGVYDLLDAMATIRRARAAHLSIAGEGPELEQLRQRASELGIAGDVEFMGHLAEGELASLYERADVFVFPTYFLEGMPTVLLEAMSFGLPIVTTRLRGAADYLAHEQNALFVPPRDPEAVAAAVERLLDEEPLRNVMAENNLVRVRDFAPDRVVQAYVRVFEEVLGDGSPTMS